MKTTDKQAELLHAFADAVSDYEDELADLTEWTRALAHWADRGEFGEDDYADTTRKLESARQSWEGLLLAWRDVWERQA